VSIIITAGLWALISLAIFPLSQGTLPFQLKLFDEKGTPFLGRILTFEGSLFLALAIMGLAYLITIRRPVPDMAARAPAVAVARAETLGMVGYAIVAQIAGAFLGHAWDTLWLERAVHPTCGHHLGQLQLRGLCGAPFRVFPLARLQP